VSVSIVFARSLAAEFEFRGLETSALLRQSGLSRERLRDGTTLLVYDEAVRLAYSAVALSRDEAIGHAAGFRTPPTSVPLLSSILLAQNTLRSAAACFARYAKLVTEGPRYSLQENGDEATWAFVPAMRPNSATRVMADFAVAMTVRISASMAGVSQSYGDGLLRAVHFQHEEPAYSAVYRASYPCPVVFGKAYNGVVFARELLGRPLRHADSTVVELLQAPLEQRLREAALERSWADRLRFVLEHRTDFIGVDGSDIAQALACSERTLRRHLEREGVSLGALMDQARCRLACRLLEQQTTSIGELSRRLGFSSTNTFGRAFRSWTGQTPAAYRRSQSDHGAHSANSL